MNIGESEKQSSAFGISVLGFEQKIDTAGMFHLSFSAMNDMHKDGRFRDAVEYFNGHVLPAYVTVFDAIFLQACLDITENVDDYRHRYMLIKGEFSRLMTRAGIAAKPDIKVIYKAPWEVPKSINDMSFDGAEKAEDDE